MESVELGCESLTGKSEVHWLNRERIFRVMVVNDGLTDYDGMIV